MTEREPEFRFGFEPDPDGGAGVDPDLAASWGWFELWTGNTNLCEHVAGGQVTTRVTWHLLTLLEWFVTHWERIFSESRIPAAMKAEVSARQSWLASRPLDLSGAAAEEVESWWAAHALRAAAEGGLFPDVYLRRHRDHLEVSWGHTPAPGAPAGLRFLAASGRCLAPVAESAAGLHQALGKAIGDLQLVRTSPRIEQLAAAHARLPKGSPD